MKNTPTQVAYSDEQFAGRYGKHRSWTWRELKKDPKFPKPVKIGGSTRWWLADIEAWERGLVEASA